MNWAKQMCICFAAFFLMATACSAADAAGKPFVVPEMKQWVPGKGCFVLKNSSAVVTASDNPEVRKILHRFCGDYRLLHNVQLATGTGKAKAGDIEFRLAPKRSLGSEGYTIDITSKVVVTASTVEGLYWGSRTLLQMSEAIGGASFQCGVVRDYPDFAMRGFMLDCGRKFIPMSYLRDLVKVMSYYKMNVLQVHLNDNGFKQYYNHDWSKTYAAFRLQSDTYPGLAAFDGYYTKDEFRSFQKEALEEYGVEVIPEIDVPAHSLCFSQYDSSLGSKEYGMDHLNIFSEHTYEFVDRLFAEYLEGDDPVFSGRRVHIGTDEYSNERQEIVEQFRHFTNHCINLVEKYGKQACMWGALTHAAGETFVKADNVILCNWSTGFSNPEEMIEYGYQLVSIPDWDLYIVPGAPYYHDFLDLKNLYDNWTPSNIGNFTFEKGNKSILGGMFALWNDHVGNGITVKDNHYRIYPAIQTLSGKFWGNDHLAPFEYFDQQRTSLSEAPGVNQLGRIGKGESLVFSLDAVKAECSLPLAEAGYNYTIEFDVQGADESLGTVLFRSDNATFYLSDPVSGLVGYARDNYLDTFRYRIEQGTDAHICIQGDDRSVTLKVNGKVVDHKDICMRYYNGGKDSLEYYSTLVFPLQQTGTFQSTVSNLKVYNYIKE